MCRNGLSYFFGLHHRLLADPRDNNVTGRGVIVVNDARPSTSCETKADVEACCVFDRINRWAGQAFRLSAMSFEKHVEEFNLPLVKMRETGQHHQGMNT